MEISFKFNKEPGMKLKRIDYMEKKPEISVIVPYYNDKKYIEQTINSLLNQTYPYFEILVIDDGSNEKDSIEMLNCIEKLDNRIKVFHKTNEGLAATRDYGALQSSKSTKFLMFLDSDDIVDRTYVECAYWTLMTNEEASWAYSDTVGFGKFTYRWNKLFDSKSLEKENTLIATSVIRKEAFWEVNGFELKEKAVNEDWNFWLKQISKNRFPVHMSFYGQWYRRKGEGELAKAEANKKRTLKIIRDTIKKIDKKVFAIEYPKYDYCGEELIENQERIIIPERNEKFKKSILLFLSAMENEASDFINIDLIKELNKQNYEVIVISTFPSIKSSRQLFEEYATIYDLTTFLDQKNWLSFVNYIIKRFQIDLVINMNCLFGYSIYPYLKKQFSIPLIGYIGDHNDEYYNIYKNKDDILGLAKIVMLASEKSKKIVENKYNIYIIKDVKTFVNQIEKIADEPLNYVRDLEKLDTLKIIKSYLNESSDEMKKMIEAYYYEFYYKKEKLTLSQNVQKLLWKFTFWRKFVNSAFWKNTIKK